MASMLPHLSSAQDTPDYGIDAPAVLRNLWLGGALCLLANVAVPHGVLTLGPVRILLGPSLLITACFLLGEGLLYLLYVKVGKFRQRDRMLNMVNWTGDEQVLDVGCGRGLLLAGAAKRLKQEARGFGFATGIDIWSQVDMGGNSAEATERNLRLEGVDGLCRLHSVPAQQMPFPDGTFDVVLSNLCMHNIPSAAERAEAVRQIVRVLRPGGVALISDYRRVGDYRRIFRAAGFATRMHWGGLMNFPPLFIVEARKPR